MEIFNSLNLSSIVQKFEVLDYKIWRSGRYISLKIILKDHKHTGETVTESFEISLGEVLAFIEDYAK